MVQFQIANGLIEGINSLVQAAKAKARGYRSLRYLMAIIYLIAGRSTSSWPLEIAGNLLFWRQRRARWPRCQPSEGVWLALQVAVELLRCHVALAQQGQQVRPHALKPSACHGDSNNHQHSDQCREDGVINQRRATLVAPQTLKHSPHTLPAPGKLGARLEPGPSLARAPARVDH